MSKKRFLISALAIAACSAGALTLPATPAWADADEDNSLPPLVMIVFDTSGSMDYCFETDNVDGLPPHDADGNELEIYCNQFQTKQKIKDFTETREGFAGLMSGVFTAGDPDVTHTGLKVTNETGTNDFYYTTEECKGAWNTPWVGCHTEPILGYEGIREQCVHTRLTKAIAEIAGGPKTIDGKNRLVKANEQPPVRVYFNGSDYEFYKTTDPRYLKDEYLYDCTDFSHELCNSESLDYNHHCYKNDYFYCVSAIQTFGDKDNHTLAKHYNSSGDYYNYKEYYNDVISDYDDHLEDLAEAYNDDGIIQAYGTRVKFGFAGFDYTNNSDYLYKHSDVNGQLYKQHGFGISSSNPQAQAPLLYPTPYDDPEKILDRNNAVAYSVRGYWAGGGTPIGPALADIENVLTNDLMCRKEGSYTDPSYACREKAVILITDGAPSHLFGETESGLKGQGAAVWEDAARLFDDHKIKVYVVGYSMRGLNPRIQPDETVEVPRIVDDKEVIAGKWLFKQS